ncbi:hypothetical protein, partial [Candidatus Binatus sp.]|uniref:hypothetical protein n=1 Tax=Candidatus Binatus sp. TaxID=2811406 RepID=UPI003F954FF6
MASGAAAESAIALGVAQAAIAHEISAPRATARMVNFNRGIVGKNNLTLEGRAVLELLAVVFVAVGRAMQAAFREPSRSDGIGQRNAARI